MSQFLKLVSSNDFINITNIEKPFKNIQNQQITSDSRFKQIAMKEVENISSNQQVIIANTIFA